MLGKLNSRIQAQAADCLKQGRTRGATNSVFFCADYALICEDTQTMTSNVVNRAKRGLLVAYEC